MKQETRNKKKTNFNSSYNSSIRCIWGMNMLLILNGVEKNKINY